MKGKYDDFLDKLDEELLQALSRGEEGELLYLLFSLEEVTYRSSVLIKQMILKEQELCAKYYERRTEMPSGPYRVDGAHEEDNKNWANDVRLGTKAPLNYDNCRAKGEEVRRALEILIANFKLLKDGTYDFYDYVPSGYSELQVTIATLPKLDDETRMQWGKAITSFIKAWLEDLDSNNSPCPANIALPIKLLLTHSASYRDSALEKRRKRKLEKLHEKYPYGEKLNKLWQQDERSETLDHAFELTDYQKKLADIEAMEATLGDIIDGLRRLIEYETLPKLIRK